MKSCYGYIWESFSPSKNNKELPNKEGVYIFRVKEVGTFRFKVLYVGSTTDFRSRIKTHSLLCKIKKSNKMNIQILFFKFDSYHYFRRTRMEISLIRKLSPLFNIKGTPLLRTENYMEIMKERLSKFLKTDFK